MLCFNLIIFYDMFILQIPMVSFLRQCEANILVALIEGCVGGGGVLGVGVLVEML